VNSGTATGIGPLGTGTTPTTADRTIGVTTQPGLGIGNTGTGTPADVAFSQQIRGQLLNGTGMTAGTPGNTTANGSAGVASVGGLPPRMLSNVQISANNGVVTLRGTVPSEAQRTLLETRVRQMTGVGSVLNALTVAPGTPNGTSGTLGTQNNGSTLSR